MSEMADNDNVAQKDEEMVSESRSVRVLKRFH